MNPDRVIKAVREIILRKEFDVIQEQPESNARESTKMLGRRLLCVVYRRKRLFPVWDLEFKTIVTFVPATDPRVVAWLKRKFSE